MDTIRNANNNLEPGQRTMLACENKLPRLAIKSVLTISKDHDYTLWIKLYERNLAEKIIDIYSDSRNRFGLVCIHM